MNPIFEKWLEEKQAEELKKRKEFLISQGLVDPQKTTTVFTDAYGKVFSEEEAKERKKQGLYVKKAETFDAVDLTEEEYQKVLAYATRENNEPTDHELLKKISKRTGIVSTILIIYVILSVIGGIIWAVSL